MPFPKCELLPCSGKPTASSILRHGPANDILYVLNVDGSSCGASSGTPCPKSLYQTTYGLRASWSGRLHPPPPVHGCGCSLQFQAGFKQKYMERDFAGHAESFAGLVVTQWAPRHENIAPRSVRAPALFKVARKPVMSKALRFSRA